MFFISAVAYIIVYCNISASVFSSVQADLAPFVLLFYFLLDFTVFSFFFSFQCVVGLLIINTVINYGPPAWWTFSFSGDLPSYILCDYYECFDLWQI